MPPLRAPRSFNFNSIYRPRIAVACLSPASSNTSRATFLSDHTRSLATIQDGLSTSGPHRLPVVSFSGSSPPGGGYGVPVGPGRDEDGRRPPDERTLKLGRTLRTLQERLPTLLQSPLPQDILSPHITLHLFPSTHPHLPTVSGRVAYLAALWTAPVAWGRVPIVGNVKLDIISERVMRNGGGSTPDGGASSPEKLIVRWRTQGKTKGKGVGALYRGIGGSPSSGADKITEILGGAEKRDDEEFEGLFIFEFDEEGRISVHTIEHGDREDMRWERMRVVSVTDWLLGRLGRGKGKGEELEEQLGWCFEGERRDGRRQD